MKEFNRYVEVLSLWKKLHDSANESISFTYLESIPRTLESANVQQVGQDSIIAKALSNENKFSAIDTNLWDNENELLSVAHSTGNANAADLFIEQMEHFLYTENNYMSSRSEKSEIKQFEVGSNHDDFTSQNKCKDHGESHRNVITPNIPIITGKTEHKPNMIGPKNYKEQLDFPNSCKYESILIDVEYESNHLPYDSDV